MDFTEYRRLRLLIGSQDKVSKMLGIRRETLNAREKGRGPLSYEAQLAMQALAGMKPEDRLEAIPKAQVQVTALHVLFSRAVEAARVSKRKVRAKLEDLQGRPALKVEPVRGMVSPTGAKSVRWELWQRERTEHIRLNKNVAVFACAVRFVETKKQKNESAKD